VKSLAFLLLLAVPVSAGPEIVVILEQPGQAITPTGRIMLPAGTEIPACSLNGVVMRYDVDGRVITLVNPCQAIFADGFEG
jgi:hypothetical protein